MGRSRGQKRRARAEPAARPPAAPPASPAPRGSPPWPAALAWIAPIVAAIVAYRCVSEFAFAADARMLVAENELLHDPGGALAQIRHDYFWSSAGSMIPYWRPLTKLSWWCEWQLFGADPGAFAWVSVAWHLAGIGGVLLLARDLGSRRGAAVLAALAYALHPVAIEPVCLLMARSDVAAAASAVWSVLAWRRWSAGAPRAGAWLAVHLVATLAALASKEVAATLPGVLVAWAALERAPGVAPRRRLASCLPAVALTAAYLVARRAVLAAEHPDLPAFHLDARPLRAFASIGVYLANTWPASLRSGVRDVAIGEAASPAFVARAAVAWGGLVAALAVAWRRRDGASLALLAWALAVLAPVVLTRDISVPTGADKYPLADRWLYHALAPALIAWTRLVEPLARRPLVARGAVAAAAAWSAVLLARARADRMPLSSELAMLDNEDEVFYRAIPAEHRTPGDECRFQERRVARASMRGEPAAAADAAEDALRVCGPAESRSCLLPWIALTELARGRGDPREAARRAERAYACGGERDASLLVAGATWLVDADEPAAARALLDRAARHALTTDQAEQSARLRRRLDAHR